MLEDRSFSGRLGKGLGSGIGEGVNRATDFALEMQKIKGKQKGENDFLKQILGSGNGMSNGSELSPEQETVLALTDPQKFNAYKHLKESRGKESEKAFSLNQSLNKLDKLEGLANKAGLLSGIGVGSKFNPFSWEDRGEYEAISASLIPLLASGVSIRNQREFDKYADILSNPSAPVSKIKGAIKGLRGLIESEIKFKGSSQPKEENVSEKKVIFNPNNKEHIAKLRQLEKKFGGDKLKVNAALAREFK